MSVTSRVLKYLIPFLIGLSLPSFIQQVSTSQPFGVMTGLVTLALNLFMFVMIFDLLKSLIGELRG